MRVVRSDKGGFAMERLYPHVGAGFGPWGTFFLSENKQLTS
jgi:hypothetical protein